MTTYSGYMKDNTLCKIIYNDQEIIKISFDDILFDLNKMTHIVIDKTFYTNGDVKTIKRYFSSKNKISLKCIVEIMESSSYKTIVNYEFFISNANTKYIAIDENREVFFTKLNSNKIHRYLEDIYGNKTWFDTRGNEIHRKDSNGFEFWAEYDEKNNLIHYKNSKGNEEWRDYDENNKLIQCRCCNEMKN